MPIGTVDWFNPQKGFGFIIPDDGGEPVFVHVRAAIRSGLSTLWESQRLSYDLLSSPRTSKAMAINLADAVVLKILPAALVLPESPAELIQVTRECNDELIRELQRNPDGLFGLSPSQFEDLIARMYESKGFAVERVGRCYQADGGVDILAVSMIDDDHPVKIAIQCKRFAKHRKVSAEPIRSLAGVLTRFEAHSGVVATTSIFTPNAIEELRNSFWQIRLKDFHTITEALRNMNDRP